MSKIHNVGLNLGKKIANPFKTSRNISTPNPFINSNSTPNPFINSNFEGNSLPFADVFEGFKPVKTSKFKMIASSVAGSMTKLHSSISESISNFVNRVKGGISTAWSKTGIPSAWDYAKKTNISDIAGIKQISDTMNMDVLDIGKGISHSVSGLGSKISDKMSFLNKDVVEIGKDISDKMSTSYLNKDVREIGKDISDKMSSSYLNKDVIDIGKDLSEKWNSLISSVHKNKISKDTSVEDLRSMWLNEISLMSEKEVA